MIDEPSRQRDATLARTIDDHAGWFHEPHGHAYDTDRCTIAVRTSDMDWSEFVRDFHLQRPVLIRPSETRAESVRHTHQQWSKQRLLSEYGASEVVLGTAHHLSAFGEGRLTMPLSDYIADMATASNTSTDTASTDRRISRTHYLFDRRRFLHEHRSMLDAYQPLPLFAADGDVYSPKLTFALGPTGTGINFHAHKDGWNEVIHGRKRWLFYAPTSRGPPRGFNQFESAAEWFDAEYDQLAPEDMPEECMQHAGDVMYVPEGWLHAIINLGETMAVAGQAEKTTPGTHMHAIGAGMRAGDAGDHQAALRHYEEAVHIQPTSAQAHNLLGGALRSMGDGVGAIASFAEAVRLNPLYALAWTRLGQTQLQMREYDAARHALETADRLAPGVYDTLLGLAKVRYMSRDLVAAAPLLERAIEAAREQYGGFTHQLRGVITNLCTIYTSLGDHTSVISTARRWLDVFPEDESVRFVLERAMRQAEELHLDT